MLHFATDMVAHGAVLTKTYNGPLVVLSVAIAIIAAYSAFYSSERILSSYHGLTRLLWVGFGSITMGLGVWSMHFIGMLALQLTLPVTYDVSTTLLSILPAIFASSVVLWSMTKLDSHHSIYTLFNAVLMGAGIAIMHHSGMAAMQLEASMSHHPGLFALSIVLAIVISFFSLKIQSRTAHNMRSSFKRKLLSASVMGAAISSMHYTAMASVEFIPSETLHATSSGFDKPMLAISVTVVTILILSLSISVPYILRFRQLTHQLNRMLDSARIEKNKRIRGIVNSAHDALIQIDAEGEIIGWSHQASKLSHWEESIILGHKIDMLILPIDQHDSAHSVYETLEKALAKRRSAIFEARLQKRGGEICPIEVAASAFHINGNVEFNLFIRDVTARKLSEERLKLFSRVFHAAHEGIVVTDPNAIILDVNPRFTQITGYQKEDVIGFNINLLRSKKHDHRFYRSMQRELLIKGFWQGEVWYQRKNTTALPIMMSISVLKNEENKVANYVCLILDISEITEQKKQLEFLAHYDALTELPNRILLADRFKQAKSFAHRHNTTMAICFLDLDDFKDINDQYDHQMGDQVLIQVAARIKRILRETDTIARQGGDEFVLLLGELSSVEQCEHTLKRIIEIIAQPYVIQEKTLSLNACIGYTLYPEDDADFDTLLRHADQAMYQAKLIGKGQHAKFDINNQNQHIQRHKRLLEIEQATLNGEMVLFYQPKVNMRTGEIIGAEALIRWQHPQKGTLPPANFLPDIQNTYVETVIGLWVIRECINQQEIWLKQGLNIVASINVSSSLVLMNNFVSEIRACLKKHPLVPASNLQLEILESSALSNLNSIRKVLSICKSELGISIALDDFGTGYSSLSHLNFIPADTIKIDRSFIKDILHDVNAYMIVDGIINLAHTFKRHVIAEGVETTEQGELLIQLGCTGAQGYCISPPKPAHDFFEWTRHYEPNRVWLGSTSYLNKQHTIPLL